MAWVDISKNIETKLDISEIIIGETHEFQKC